MRILVFGLSAQMGGVESFIINYCSAIERSFPAIEFEFIVFDAMPVYTESLVECGHSFHVVPSRTRDPFGYIAAIDRILSEGAYDGIWYHACTLSDVTLLKRAKDKVPIRILHSHNSQNMGNLFNGMLHKVHKRRVSDLATDLFACSAEAARFMFPEDGLVEDGVSYVRNGVDVERFAFDRGIRNRVREEHGWDDDFLIATTGRMHKQKNPFFLIDVFECIRRKRPSSRLLYMGDGPLREEVERYIAEKGLEGSVELLGSVENVEDYLSAADIFLLPSLYEGLPFAAVEAQASGLPCILSDGVSDEAVLTSSTLRLPLSAGPEHWATTILQTDTSGNRESDADEVALKGFSIESNARDLGTWLMGRQSDVAC